MQIYCSDKIIIKCNHHFFLNNLIWVHFTTVNNFINSLQFLNHHHYQFQGEHFFDYIKWFCVFDKLDFCHSLICTPTLLYSTIQIIWRVLVSPCQQPWVSPHHRRGSRTAGSPPHRPLDLFPGMGTVVSGRCPPLWLLALGSLKKLGHCKLFSCLKINILKLFIIVRPPFKIF